MNREQIRAVLEKKLQEEESIPDLEKERKALLKLGVIAADYDYVRSLLDLLEQQVAGFYDPESKKLYIADWLPPPIQDMTLAHELTHALQDQRFGLKDLLQPVPGNDDLSIARRALVEGEAVAVMLDYLLEPQKKSFVDLPDLSAFFRQLPGLEGEGEGQKIPEFIEESLLFPYLKGIVFMQAFKRHSEWAKADSLYSDPPVSTEQILHPEKYFDSRDIPSPVCGDAAAGDEDWTVIYSNTLGEFSTGLVLKKFLPVDAALQAAAGWDGDSFQLLEAGDGRLKFRWRSVWDTREDASEFSLAYRELLGLKYPGIEPAPSAQDANTQEWSRGGDRIRLRKEDTCVVIDEIEDH